jgi:hypothetical protein
MDYQQRPGAGDALLPNPPGQPVNVPSLRVPECAQPDHVRAKSERLAQLVDRLEDLSDKRKRLKAQATDVEADEIRADVDRVAAGEPMLTTKERRLPKIQAELAECERERYVVSKAALAAHLLLVQETKASRVKWLEAVEAEHAKAEAHYQAALSQLGQAANALRETWHAKRWLEDVDAKGVPVGNAVRQLPVRFGRELKDVADVLAALRTATGDAAVRKSKPKVVVGAEAEAAS